MTTKEKRVPVLVLGGTEGTITVTLRGLLAARAFGIVSYMPLRGFVALELDRVRIRKFLALIGEAPR